MSEVAGEPGMAARPLELAVGMALEASPLLKGECRQSFVHAAQGLGVSSSGPMDFDAILFIEIVLGGILDALPAPGAQPATTRQPVEAMHWPPRLRHLHQI